ncbi:hypothetical protein [Paenibacillus sp. N3.4]|uniref:hypothetical protein n=1 Tax=Paenibacillus sp. N3.4 TaxID=2603222 RepID=UPI0011C7E1AA|nr:hypothetical protein [Paenibacillus sp. N3.4]TXK77727.1 hypothetical protein FU659_21850 [Paenibacillus sp. N3.4]
MEMHLAATFSSMDDLEQAAEALQLQGVLAINFDHSGTLLVNYQAETFLQSIDSYSITPTFSLSVSVEKSRYRQAEDTITKYGGQLHKGF